MASDTELVERLRDLLVAEEGLEEKAMFGGKAFLVHGHLVIAASAQGGLLVRTGPDSAALSEHPSAEPFVMRGRPMEGWLRVGEGGYDDDAALWNWVAAGLGVARALLPKR